MRFSICSLGSIIAFSLKHHETLRKQFSPSTAAKRIKILSCSLTIIKSVGFSQLNQNLNHTVLTHRDNLVFGETDKEKKWFLNISTS